MTAGTGNRRSLGEALRRARNRAGAVLRFALYWALCWAALAVSGCVGFDVEAVRDLEPDTGDAFTQTLAEEYRSFALFEADEMYDWFDADHFARKGLRAGAGEAVQPEALEDWRMPRETLPQLKEAREVLVTALEERRADDTAAVLVARAQSQFDCWVEQQEENHQWDDIAACRDGFYSNIKFLSVHLEMKKKADLKAAALPEPAPTPEEEEGVPFAVTLFAFDSAMLTDSGRVAAQSAAEEAVAEPAARVVVIGHTDRSGTDAYNLELSLRRGDAVREALIASGVAPERIEVVARGEWDPAVPTADGVREPANRRVEILFQPLEDPAPTSEQTQMPLAPAAGQDAAAESAAPHSLGILGSLGLAVKPADRLAAARADAPEAAVAMLPSAMLPAAGLSAPILPDPGCFPSPRCAEQRAGDGPAARRPPDAVPGGLETSAPLSADPAFATGNWRRLRSAPIAGGLP